MSRSALVIDSTATTRISLKVKLLAAGFSAQTLATVKEPAVVGLRETPALVLLRDADTLAQDLGKLRSHPLLQAAQIVVYGHDVSAERCLGAGADEVMKLPIDDVFLSAKLSMIAARGLTLARPNGFAEGQSAFGSPPRIQLRAQTPDMVAQWPARLRPYLRGRINITGFDSETRAAAPVGRFEIIMVELDTTRPERGLHQIARLRAREATRDARLIAILSGNCRRTELAALELGVHEVAAGTFSPREVAHRARRQMRLYLADQAHKAALRMGLREMYIDALTRLCNRRSIDETLPEELRKSRLNGTPLSVILADIDHFKSINDRYGHPAGDQVLRELALRIQCVSRSGDTISRFGGEEFLILLPDTTPDAARGVARRLLDAVCSTPIKLPCGSLVSVTISAGVTSVCTSIDTPDDMIKRADQALYCAKTEGRSRFCVASPARHAA